MFGKKTDDKKKLASAQAVEISGIIIEENLSKAKIKEYNALLMQAQQQLLDKERKIHELREEVRQKKENLPLDEQQTAQYEQKRALEKKDCEEHLTKECEKLSFELKKQRKKKNIHKLAGSLLLIAIVTGAVFYYLKVYSPVVKAVEQMTSDYETRYQNLEKEYRAELDIKFKEQQQIWNDEILALEEQKRILEEEIKEKLQTAY